MLSNKYKKTELDKLLEIFDNLVYNPVFNSDFILSKVNIEVFLRD